MQAHELSLLSLGRDNLTTLNYSLNTHAPDQTGSRSRVLCCADADPDVHRCLVDKVFPRRASVMTAVELLDAMG
jgi:hypothetical protein